MLLDIKKSKSGEALVITDAGGDVHACTGAEEFWKTIRDLIDNPEIPKQETATPGNGKVTQAEPVEEGEYEYVEDEGGEPFSDDMVADFAGRALTGLLGGLQRASFRGKKRRKKKPPAQEGAEGGS